QWTQFESFPRFMAGIDRVVQVDPKTLEWTATIAGVIKHWRAEIVEELPDEVVAWRSIEGAHNDGAVQFEALGPDRTRVSLTLDVEPEGLVEKAADALGVVERRVRGLRYLADAGLRVVLVTGGSGEPPAELRGAASEVVATVPVRPRGPAWYLTSDIARCQGASARLRTVLIGGTPPTGSVRRCD